MGAWKIRRAYASFFEEISWTLQPAILLVFRLYWGFRFYKVGSGKLASHGSVTEYFAGLGIPFPGTSAWFIGGLEYVGGILLMAGLFSRPVAFLMVCAMSVAYLTAHTDDALSIVSNPKAFLSAEPYHFLVMSLLVLAFGPGRFSLDAACRRWFK